MIYSDQNMLKGYRQQKFKLTLYERAFKMLKNNMCITKIGQAVLELRSEGEPANAHWIGKISFSYLTNSPLAPKMMSLNIAQLFLVKSHFALFLLNYLSYEVPTCVRYASAR